MSISIEASNLSLIYFQRKFPYASKRTYDELIALKAKYFYWRIFLIVLVLILMLVLPVLYAYALHPITVYFHKLFIEKGAIYYSSDPLILIVTTFFWGLATLVFWSEWIFRILLRNNYEEFEDYYNDTQKYDNHRAGLWFAKICFVLSMLTFPFTFSASVITGNKGFSIKRFTDFSTHHYSYKDVSGILYYHSYMDRQGNVIAKPLFKFYFSDGELFSPGFYFGDTDRSVMFANTLSAKSGIPIDTVDIMSFNEKDSLSTKANK